MNTTQLLGIVAGILTSISMLPQLIKMIKEKKAGDVSIVMLSVLIAGLVLWTVYGFVKKDMPIIVTNIFSFLLNVTVLIFRIKYSGTGE